MATLYRLESAPFVHTPGLVSWAINGWAFEDDRPQLRKIFLDGYPGLTPDAVDALLSRRVPYKIVGSTIEFIA